MIPSRQNLILLSLLYLSVSAAHALQTIEVRDSQTVAGKMSLREQTRIKVEHGKITDIVGDVRDPSNPQGRVILVPDATAGEIYIRLVDPSNPRPVNLFIKTDKRTVGLLLQPVDMPLDTIVLRDRGLSPGESESEGAGPSLGQSVSAERMPRSAAYLRSLKAMFVAMAGDTVPAEIEVRPVRRDMLLWKESRFSLERLYVASSLVGERYRLTNISSEPMILAEQEFYRDSIRGVAIELHQLRPGQSTVVYVVRDRTDGE